MANQRIRLDEAARADTPDQTGDGVKFEEQLENLRVYRHPDRLGRTLAGGIDRRLRARRQACAIAQSQT